MKKTIATFSFYILTLGCAFSQSDSLKNNIYTTLKYRKGVYMNHREFQRNNPSDTTAVYANRFNKQEEIVDKYYPKKVKNNKNIMDYWGFCDGQKVYIHNDIMGYAIKLEEIETISWGYSDKKERIKGEIAVGVGIVVGGAIGAGINAAIINSPNGSRDDFREVFTVNLLTGKTKIIKDEADMRTLIQDSPILLEQYRTEKNKESIDTVLKYIKLYNENYKPVAK